MKPRHSNRQTLGLISKKLYASITGVVLVLCASSLVAQPSEGQPDSHAQAQPHPSAQIGTMRAMAGQSETAQEVVHLFGRALAVLDAWLSADWSDPASALEAITPASLRLNWSLEIGQETQLAPVRLADEDAPLAQAFLFDIRININSLREHTRYPQSRSVRGHVLDALGLDNARHARLVAVEGLDDPDRVSIALMATSRAQSPGRWHARPIATAGRVAYRGEQPSTMPIEIDFGERWSAVLLACADSVLSQSPMPETISSKDRFAAWGKRKTQSLQACTLALGPQVYAWPGAKDDGLVLAFPVAQRSSVQAVARQIKILFGPRLVWTRDENHRAVGMLGFGADGARAGEAERKSGLHFSLRFVTILKSSYLVVATDPVDLDAAPGLLSKIMR